jgi:exopolysaccharide production protein ExoZ
MLLNLQALRALAAFLVIIYHWKPLFQQTYDGTWVEAGRSGVDLFFVISGFIMVYITAQKPVRPSAFLMHRIIRIVPLYWVMTMVIFAIAVISPTFFGAIRPNFLELAQSLFFIPFSKLNGRMEPLLPVGWTLDYEMFFYALFFAGLFIRNLRVGAWTVIGLLAGLIALGTYLHPEKTSPVSVYTNQLLAEFAFGMILGLNYDSVARLRINLRLVSCVPAVALLFIFASPWFAPHDARSLFFGIPAAFIVAAALNLETRGLVVSNSFIQLLGAATYAIYLSHFFIIGLFIRVAQRFHVHGGMEYILYVAVGTAIITAVGIGLHLYLEKPLIRLARVICTWRPETQVKRVSIPGEVA